MNRLLVAIMCCLTSSTTVRAADADDVWPQWRGPDGTGYAKKADPPIEWSETKNIRWKVAIPGKGNATPIIWEDRIYIQTAIKTEKQEKPAPDAAMGNTSSSLRLANSGDNGWQGFVSQQPADPGRRPRVRRGRGRRAEKPTHVYRFVVMALDRNNGKVIWEKTACESVPHEAGHPDSSQASNSPVTDGKHLYAFFGSRGLYCLDMNGKLKWHKEFGRMQTRAGFGEGSSPALYGDTVVVNWDHEGQSFVVALNKITGKQLWKVDRDEQTSWTTPIIVEDGSRRQVIIGGSNFVRSYDLATGEVIWKCKGLTANVVPTPVCDFGMVFVMSGYRGNALLAIRYKGASGDITNTDAVVWKHDKGTPYVPSPLLTGDNLFFLQRNNAILSCFDAKTGKEHYSRERLDGIEGIYASPVAARDRVYIVARNGKTLVIKRAPELKILATNALEDSFAASPAIAGNELYLRGEKSLYCIAEETLAQAQ